MKLNYDEQIENLYAEVGKLTTQLTRSKKIWHIANSGVGKCI